MATVVLMFLQALVAGVGGIGQLGVGTDGQFADVLGHIVQPLSKAVACACRNNHHGPTASGRLPHQLTSLPICC
jgi:hypothetical protein